MATVTTDSNVDFRNNDKSSADGTLWANAWVNNKEGKLLCIGATVETLQTIKSAMLAGTELNTLMLTKPTPQVAEKTGLEYDMCQLAIARVDFSFSLE